MTCFNDFWGWHQSVLARTITFSVIARARYKSHWNSGKLSYFTLHVADLRSIVFLLAKSINSFSTHVWCFSERFSIQCSQFHIIERQSFTKRNVKLISQGRGDSHHQNMFYVFFESIADKKHAAEKLVSLTTTCSILDLSKNNTSRNIFCWRFHHSEGKMETSVVV